MLCLNYDLKKCKLVVFVLLEYEPLFDMVYELLCSTNVFIRHGMLIIVLHIVRCLVNISLHNSIFNAREIRCELNILGCITIQLRCILLNIRNTSNILLMAIVDAMGRSERSELFYLYINLIHKDVLTECKEEILLRKIILQYISYMI